eukprot:1060932-Amorphochlora_amoeboformis.AAC.1
MKASEVAELKFNDPSRSNPAYAVCVYHRVRDLELIINSFYVIIIAVFIPKFKDQLLENYIALATLTRKSGK